MQVSMVNVIGSSRRPTGEWGYFAMWRTGSALTNPDGFRVEVA